uniref:Uncharacterized protein n=1 Tax=Oryza meridionalis TaxID=40149 RepID=A0A0E0CLP0_9ORYZ
MALCCRDGPDGGAGLRGKNPKKLLETPLSSGLPLNGCMPRVASQLDASSSSAATTSHHHGRLLLLLLLVCKQPAMEKTTTS